MKALQKIISIFVSILMITILLPSSVLAEGASTTAIMKFSSLTVNIGKTFTFYFNINGDGMDISAFDAIIKYDAAKLEVIKDGSTPKISLPSSSQWNNDVVTGTIDGEEIVILGGSDTTIANPLKARGDTNLFSLTFKVKDNAPVDSKALFEILDSSIMTVYNNEFTEAFVELGPSRSVTIGPKLDTNNFLSSLEVKEGDFTPAFSKTVYDYNLTVEESVTSVNVTAIKETSSANVSISGNTSLNYGDNLVTVKVTAQDATVRNYRINVHRQFPEPDPTDTPEPEPTDTPEPTETPEPEPTDIPEPTEEITSSEDNKEEKPKEKMTVWQIIAIISSSLFLITLGVAIWLLIDKIKNRNNIVKIKRR